MAGQAWSPGAAVALLSAIVAVSLAVTAWSLAYARRRDLVDLPGRRRSHSLPTPRGGGIGIVAGVLVGIAVPAFRGPVDDQGLLTPGAAGWLTLAASVILVAAVGWIDDHRGLRARVRFAAHLFAALLLVALPPVLAAAPLPPAIVGLLALAVIAIAWSINLHNFMDGIDGLLGMHALFVFVALAALCASSGCTEVAIGIGVFAAATLGFLPFNFPRARIFMGDVGSGVLGLLVAVAVGWQMLVTPVVLAAGLIACSAFIVDATATLLSRMLQGRRWYSAHREHLYQWLVRSGRSHRQVVMLYMGWNLIVVVPVLVWLHRARAQVTSTDGPFLVESGAVGLAGVYALGIVIWVFGKRWCRVTVMQRPRGSRAQ